MNASIGKTRPFIIFFVVGLVASFLPLIGDFYLETAQVASVIFSFYTIWRVGDAKFILDGEQTLQKSHLIILGSIFFKMGVFLFPVLISTLIRGCFNLDGLYFVLLIPSVGIILVYSLTILFRAYTIHYKLHTTLITIFLIVVLPLLILKNVPHVFLFNLIWGWFPGPIYDEQISMTMSLVYHGLFVLVLSLTLLLVNHSILKSHLLIRSLLLAISASLLVLFLYNWSDLGLGHSLNYIENRLGGVAESEHFVIIYDDEVLTETEVEYWIFWHEFHFNDLSQQLDINWKGEKIRSVLYRDVWQKLEYTGAKYTSYVPVWNKIPQLHLDLQSADLLLRHEMVHVLAKDFSNAFIGANLKIGLTEGIAVALEDPRTMRFTRDEILVNSDLDINTSLLDDVFSFLGFYGGRASINYSVSGSFVNYLIQNHEIDDFKCVYGGSDFDDCYESFSLIENDWVDYVSSIPADTTATLYARNYINRESIFEKKCARFMSDTEKQYDIYRMKYYRDDYSGAYEVLSSLYEEHSESATIWLNLSELGIYFKKSVPDFEFDSNHNLTDSLNVFLRQADLAVVGGDFQRAEYIFTKLDSLTLPNTAYESFITTHFALRGLKTGSTSIDESSILEWEKFIDIRYRHGELSNSTSISHQNLWLALKSNRNEKLSSDEVNRVLINGMSESNLHYIMSNIIPLTGSNESVNLHDVLLQRLEENAKTRQSINVLNMYLRAINFSESYH